MDITTQRIIIFIIVIIVAAILGRLTVRALLNFLLGGTMFGGNILWKRKEEKENNVYICMYISIYYFICWLSHI